MPVHQYIISAMHQAEIGSGLCQQNSRVSSLLYDYHIGFCRTLAELYSVDRAWSLSKQDQLANSYYYTDFCSLMMYYEHTACPQSQQLGLSITLSVMVPSM